MRAAPDGRRPRVLHYCQHSVGLGHLVRSLSVAGALARRFDVVLVSGGPVPNGIEIPAGVELVPLPPVGSADGSTDLVSLEDGTEIDEVWQRRSEILLRTLDEVRPAAVVIELFPLGRRKFAGEIIPLLQRAHSLAGRPVVVCSVRDILVRKEAVQQARDDEAARRLDQWFDAVVVHGDPRLARLEETFCPAVPLRVPVHYSGYVVPPPTVTPVRDDPGAGEVLVSAGGGLVGGPLLLAAAAAHRLELEGRGIVTRIVTGPFLPAEDRARLEAEAASCQNLVIEGFVPDLRARIATAAVSVSQAGYNTSLDVLRAGVPALVVPYEAPGETEQRERAHRLAALGALRVLPADELTPPRLAAEITDLLSQRPKAVELDFAGAERTARIVAALVDARSARSLPRTGIKLRSRGALRPGSTAAGLEEAAS